MGARYEILYRYFCIVIGIDKYCALKRGCGIGKINDDVRPQQFYKTPDVLFSEAQGLANSGVVVHQVSSVIAAGT